MVIADQNPGTPILDRLAPLPPELAVEASALWKAVETGVGAIMIALVLVSYPTWSAWMAENNAFPDRWTAVATIAFGAGVVAAYVAAVSVHEAGHALTGAMLGFRIDAIRIGPLHFAPPFRIALRRGGPVSGGSVSMVPLRQGRLVLRYVVVLFAGAAANVLSAGVLLLAPGPLATVGAFFVFFSLTLGPIGLVPFRSRGVFSDGAQVVMVLRNAQRAQRWFALLALSAELRDGVPPASLSGSWLAKAVAIRDNAPETISAYGFAYAAAYWRHDDAEAAQFLETCLHYASYASPIQREALMCDAAVFQARRRKRVDVAGEWRDVLPPSTGLPWLRLHADAAILEAGGDRTGALAKLDASEVLICRYKNHDMGEIALRLLRLWQRDIRT